MKTSLKEEYLCTLPSLIDSDDEKEDKEVSTDHQPQNLLASLFKKSFCFINYSFYGFVGCTTVQLLTIKVLIIILN